MSVFSKRTWVEINLDSIEENIKTMSTEKRTKLIDDLSFLELPIKKDIIKGIIYDIDIEMMDSWKNRFVYVDGVIYEEFNQLLRKNNMIDGLFKNQLLKDISFSTLFHAYNINIKMQYLDVIEDYLKNKNKLNTNLVLNHKKNGNEDALINEMKMIGIQLSDKEKVVIGRCFYKPLFMNMSKIIDIMEYDKCLKEWCGDYEWKLIYRASEHGYTARSFHECCDDEGPTLIVIKSSEGWIFGGYTTQSWNGFGIDYDIVIINRY